MKGYPLWIESSGVVWNADDFVEVVVAGALVVVEDILYSTV